MNNTLIGRIASIKLNSSGNLEIALDGTEADGRLSMIVCEINNFSDPELQKWAEDYLEHDYLIWARLWTQRKTVDADGQKTMVNVTYIRKIEVRDGPRY